MSAVSALYEPLIARDLPAVEGAVRAFRQTGTSHDLFLAVARFAVLSFAPSQHAKHAVLAALAAYELREELGERWDDLLIELAYYAAASRQPWSEPPIAGPPEVDRGTPADLDQLRAAIAARDRLQAERWLARNLDAPALARDLATVSAEDLSDLGHKIIMANASLKLVPILGEKGRYVTLRMAAWELTSSPAERRAWQPDFSPERLRHLIDRCVAEEGSLEAAHGVFLFDAWLELLGDIAAPPSTSVQPRPAPPVYRLGRDLGAALKAHAVAKRLGSAFPEAGLETFVAAVQHNLETATSLEEWSFA